MIRAKVSPSSSSPAVASAAASRGVRASRRGGFAATTAGRARDGEDRRRCCSVAVSAGAGRLGRDGGDRRRASSVISVGTSATRLNAVADKPSVDMIKGLTKPKDDTEYSAPPSVSDVLHDQTYAIVEVGGTQLIVQEGRQYVVNHLNVRGGNSLISFTPVKRNEVLVRT